MTGNEEWCDYPDRRTARRAAALRLHPDIGGSAEELESAFAEIDARFGVFTGPSSQANIVIAHGKMSTARRIARRIYRRAGQRIPGRSNRYITL